MNWKLKCTYLQKENKILSQEWSDTQKLLAASQLALNENDQSIYFKEQINVLQRQNEILKQERNLAMDRALISEQVCQCLEDNEKCLIKDFMERIKSLQQKMNYVPFQECDRFFVKPNEQTMKMHNLIEKQNTQLLQFYQQIQELKENRQELVKMNFALSNELQKNQSEQLPNQPKFMVSFAKFESMLLNNSHEQEPMSPIFSPLPIKVQHSRTKSEITIPKLDIQQAQKIQEYNLKRTTQKLSQISDPQERIQYLMRELVATRNKYHKCQLHNNSLELYSEELRRQVEDLQGNNEILIESNRRYEAKWQTFYSTYIQYQNFYKSHATDPDSSIQWVSKQQININFLENDCDDCIK